MLIKVKIKMANIKYIASKIIFVIVPYIDDPNVFLIDEYSTNKLALLLLL